MKYETRTGDWDGWAASMFMGGREFREVRKFVLQPSVLRFVWPMEEQEEHYLLVKGLMGVEMCGPVKQGEVWLSKMLLLF